MRGNFFFLVKTVFWPLWVSVSAGRFPVVVASRGCAPGAELGLLAVLASLVPEHPLESARASFVVACGLQSAGSEVAACGLSLPTWD